jgi:alpha-tubulin suppressor-like RCC1 family protein
VTGLRDVTAIAAGETHTCALRRDGSVACWGATIIARIERPDPAEVGVATTVRGIGPADAIFAGDHMSCARVGDTPWCWGRPDVDRPPQRPTAMRALKGAEELAFGKGYACARVGGELRCALEDPRTWKLARRYSALPGISDARALSAGSNHLCALRDRGRVSCFGGMTVGDGPYRGDWSAGFEVEDVAPARRLLPTGGAHGCVLRDDGEVRCWGDAGHGQLGHGLAQPWRRPVAVAGLRSPRALAGGWDHTCAITQTREVVCWGRNDVGQAGWTPPPRELPEVTIDRRSGKDPVASQMRGLLARRLAPVVVTRLAR